MDKKVRKATRVFLLKDNCVLAIKYFTKNQLGYYDLPGGKIEDGETSIDAAIREFQEESGMDVFNLKYAGNLIAKYPDRIFDFDIYICHEYHGMPQRTIECDSMWIDIDLLLNEDKIFPSISLLSNSYRSFLVNERNFTIQFICDSNHKILKEK